jgi:hypothetical protein
VPWALVKNLSKHRRLGAQHWRKSIVSGERSLEIL